MILKGVYPLVFGRSKQLSVNEFFYPTTPSSFWCVTILGLVADGVWKGLYSWVFGRSKQLSLNTFFDPSTPSMRKGRDGERRLLERRTLAPKMEEKRLMRIRHCQQLTAGVPHARANSGVRDQETTL